MRGTADGSFSPEIKSAVALRAREGCERCGRWCGEGSWSEYHHRIPRGMGGTAGERATTLSSPANCLLLCHLCHRWIESNRSASFAAGWLVDWALDPAETPVEIYGRGPVLLDVDGDYARVGGVLPAPEARPGMLRARW